jgi:uncharacterized membrane protein
MAPKNFLNGAKNNLVFCAGTMDPKDFLSEAQIMKKLRHPKLIQVSIC